MALADTARLLAELAFSDKMSPGIHQANASLVGLTKSVRLQEFELGKLKISQAEAFAKAQGPLSAQQKAYFAQQKAINAAGIAQERYRSALVNSSLAAENLNAKQSRLSQLSGLASAALRTMGGVASLGFAAAARGAVELEDVQVDIQRETGLTATAAKEAATAINGIAGRNVQDLSVVAATFEKLHNDMGLTGQAAIDATDAFVKFGRATNQGPADAVKAFDDILDSWNLTADHSQEIMDKLVASHQKYGGSIEDNEAALRTLAPQLQALNVNIDGAIGLLNLFETSGLDSTKALQAMNFAVKALKPGQSLDDLIRQVSSIEDPTKRAQKAIELFGARGGVALANSLRPGITGLKDFEVSASDAAGATQKAVDVIDSSISGRFKKALSEGEAALRGFGQNFGPALTGLASLGTLSATVAPGLGSGLVKAVGSALRGVAGSAAVKAGAGAVGAVIGTAMSAATGIATKLADVVTTAVSALITKSGIRAASVAAGAALGAVFGAAYGAAADATQGVVGVIGGLAGGRVGAVAAAAGQNIGVRFGTGILVGLTGLAFFKTIQDALPKPEGMQDFFDSYTKGAGAAAGANDQFAASTSQLDPVLAEEIDQGKAATAQVEALTAANNASVVAVDRSVAAADRNAKAFREFGPVGAEYAARLKLAAAGVTTFANESDAATAAWAKKFSADMHAGINAARDLRAGLDGEFAQFLSDFKNFRTRTGEEAHIFGELVDKSFRKGLHDARPDVRKEAEGVQLDALGQLRKLVKAGDKVGKDGMQALRDGMHSKNAIIRDAANEIYNTVTSHLPKHKVGTDAGHATGQGVADGLNSKAKPVSAAASHLRRLIEANLPSNISTTIDVKVHYQPGGKGSFATGGIIAAGSSGFVGEAGIERADALPGGGVRITPLSTVAAASPYVPQAPKQAPSWSAQAMSRVQPLINVAVSAIVTTRSVVDGLAKAKTYGSLGGVATPGLPTP